MLLGCISTNYTGKLINIEGKLNATGYEEILEKNLQDSARKLQMGQHWMLQQDKNPKHTAKSQQKWFSEKKVKVLQWLL